MSKPPDLTDISAVIAYIMRYDWPTDRLMQERLQALINAATKPNKGTRVWVACIGDPHRRRDPRNRTGGQ